MPRSRRRCAIAETELSRRLAAIAQRPDAIDAFKLARRWFVGGQRFEMRDLAAELGISRATLFRWVGGRDELLAEILWSLAAPTLQSAVDAAPGRGGARIAAILGRFSSDLMQADYFNAFLRREPERALRILTTRAGNVQSRMIDAVEALLQEEVSRDALTVPLPIHDCAYLLTRVAETFIYADLITNERPDPAKVEQAVNALLRP